MPAFKTFATFSTKLQKALDLLEENKVKQATTIIRNLQASAQKRSGAADSDSNTPKKKGASKALNRYMQFAMENRDVVRNMNDKMPITGVSKILGARWAEVKTTWMPGTKVTFSLPSTGPSSTSKKAPATSSTKAAPKTKKGKAEADEE